MPPYVSVAIVRWSCAWGARFQLESTSSAPKPQSCLLPAAAAAGAHVLMRGFEGCSRQCQMYTATVHRGVPNEKCSISASRNRPDQSDPLVSVSRSRGGGLRHHNNQLTVSRPCYECVDQPDHLSVGWASSMLDVGFRGNKHWHPVRDTYRPLRICSRCRISA